MAEETTKLPNVEDINIDDADDGPDVETGEDGNPVKLTVRGPSRCIYGSELALTASMITN